MAFIYNQIKLRLCFPFHLYFSLHFIFFLGYTSGNVYSICSLTHLSSEIILQRRVWELLDFFLVYFPVLLGSHVHYREQVKKHCLKTIWDLIMAVIHRSRNQYYHQKRLLQTSCMLWLWIHTLYAATTFLLCHKSDTLVLNKMLFCYRTKYILKIY